LHSTEEQSTKQIDATLDAQSGFSAWQMASDLKRSGEWHYRVGVGREGMAKTANCRQTVVKTKT